MTIYIFTGTYQGSWTWFEAAIIRDFQAGTALEEVSRARIERTFCDIKGARNPKVTLVTNPNNDSDVWHIQQNKRADKSFSEHKVRWSLYDKDNAGESKNIHATGAGLGAQFVQSIQPNDRIAVLARAKVQFHCNFVTLDKCLTVLVSWMAKYCRKD